MYNKTDVNSGTDMEWQWFGQRYRCTGCQKVSVHLIIIMHMSGAQRLFDHPV